MSRASATAARSSSALADGMLAGFAGGTALNAVTYLDMLLRARPASQTPAQAAGRVADLAHLDLGPREQAANRRSGLGPLLGQLGAVATTVTFALLARRRLPVPVAAFLLGAGAMVASDGPIVALRVSDPRQWSRADWIEDLIPHLVFGWTAALTLDRLRAHRPDRPRVPWRGGRRG